MADNALKSDITSCFSHVNSVRPFKKFVCFVRCFACLIHGRKSGGKGVSS